MNYRVITDEQMLKDFIESLPELEPNETFYCCLFARSKYTRDDQTIPHIKSDKAQLKRFTSDKKRLFQKIKQLETEVGNYTLGDIEVPQEALAFYMNINPRCQLKATKELGKVIMNFAWTPYNGWNIHQEALSAIQESKSRSVYIDFDFDVDKATFPLKSYIESSVNLSAVKILETRGGFHVLVDPAKVFSQYSKSWYKNLIKEADQARDCMIPVPGTYQGGFTPHFIDL